MEEITICRENLNKNDDTIESVIEIIDISEKKIANENKIQNEFIIQKSVERLQSVEMARNIAECNVFQLNGAIFSRLRLY